GTRTRTTTAGRPRRTRSWDSFPRATTDKLPPYPREVRPRSAPGHVLDTVRERSGRDGQRHLERRPATGRLDDDDISAVRADERPDDRQPEPRAARRRVARRIDTVEPLE